MEYLRDKINGLRADNEYLNERISQLEKPHRLFACPFCKKDITTITPLFLMSNIKLECNICVSPTDNICSLNCGHVCCQTCCNQLQIIFHDVDFSEPLTQYMLDAFHNTRNT